jgi:hypothetical protein
VLKLLTFLYLAVALLTLISSIAAFWASCGRLIKRVLPQRDAGPRPSVGKLVLACVLNAAFVFIAGCFALLTLAPLLPPT